MTFMEWLSNAAAILFILVVIGMFIIRPLLAIGDIPKIVDALDKIADKDQDIWRELANINGELEILRRERAERNDKSC